MGWEREGEGEEEGEGERDEFTAMQFTNPYIVHPLTLPHLLAPGINFLLPASWKVTLSLCKAVEHTHQL